MNGLDIVGIVLLASIGFMFVWLGKNATARKLDLNLGRFNADNTSPADWDRMNAASGADIRRGGAIMLTFATVSVAASFLLPGGTAGIVCLATSVIGSFGIALATARRAADPSPNWHP